MDLDQMLSLQCGRLTEDEHYLFAAECNAAVA